jgi:hypothetical protein
MALSPIKVRILSFQSIEEVEFEIYGLTVITGTTNVGKSAIIRALSGALTNVPVGALVRKGAKYCSVSIDTENWGIKWEKGERGINRYFIRGKDKPLDKVGGGQIEEISSLGFNSIKVGSDQIYPWVATQFKPLFLLDQSGPAITDFISEVSHLQVLQDAISINIKNRKRSLDEIKVRSENIQKLQTKEQLLIKCDIVVKIQNELDAQALSIKEYEGKISVGNQICDGLCQTNTKLAKIETIDEVKIPNPIVDEHSVITSMYGHWLALELAARRIIVLHKVSSVPVLDDILSNNIASLIHIEKLANHIYGLNESVSILSKRIPVPRPEKTFPELLVMESISTRLDSTKVEEKALSNQLHTISTALSQVEEEISRIPLCPSCSRPTNQSHIHV